MASFSGLQNPIGTSIRFVSWNLHGLGKPTKINKVLSHLDTKIRRRWVAQLYHSLFNSRARGTLIHKSQQFTPSDIICCCCRSYF